MSSKQVRQNVLTEHFRTWIYFQLRGPFSDLDLFSAEGSKKKNFNPLEGSKKVVQYRSSTPVFRFFIWTILVEWLAVWRHNKPKPQKNSLSSISAPTGFEGSFRLIDAAFIRTVLLQKSRVALLEDLLARIIFRICDLGVLSLCVCVCVCVCVRMCVL